VGKREEGGCVARTLQGVPYRFHADGAVTETGNGEKRTTTSTGRTGESWNNVRPCPADGKARRSHKKGARPRKGGDGKQRTRPGSM